MVPDSCDRRIKRQVCGNGRAFDIWDSKGVPDGGTARYHIGGEARHMAGLISRIVSLVGIALPTFWLSFPMVYFLAYTFNWLPPLGYASLWEDPWLNLEQLFFPAWR
ncbi:MAG: hypothetical protein CM1200mP35_01560 [Chloroflexota bacterium]|nr:MAG: hypothetical protein CM1200mP35_01560 [Chloroflexota bacterium]